MNGKLDKSNLREKTLSGKAIVTFRSGKTGNRFTYKIVRSKKKPMFWVSLLTGSDNESSYTFMGQINNGKYFHSLRSNISYDAQGAKVFSWIWERIDNLPDSIEVFHEGRCLRCGRVLTVPESIETGFGPECITKVG